jgi:hypothetical protein
LAYKAKCTSGDFHEQKTLTIYPIITQEAILNLPPSSVVVMGNAPLHNTVHSNHGKYANEQD